VMQTWHGTPLKRIGFDMQRVQFATTNYLDLLRHQAQQWTHLVSPAPFASPIMRRALGFEEGKLVECGLPRNDLLRSDASAEVRDRVRRRLGLTDDQRVVLYAPTWRDNAFYGRGRYRFDLRIDLPRAAQALGAGSALLIRGHHLIADEIDTSGAPEFAINVSAWPDIQELYAASDALITDYSSVFFDFANTGRPILFYCYDLEDYRDNIRGFYLDLEAIAPGPVMTEEDALMAALADLDRVAAESAPRYEAFVRDYCTWDDGKSSARALDALFGRP
jgi:CDP-glycerol glycerophosphotransferase